MTVQTRESILRQVDEVVAGHECPYRERLVRVSTSRSSTAHLGILLSGLRQIHQDNTCPPTHVGSSPTRIWSSWVDDTAV